MKVFGRDSSVGCDFPGGYHYHNRWSFMKEIIQNKRQPYIFHMSWTANKENKKKFYEQLGEWHLQSKCVGKLRIISKRLVQELMISILLVHAVHWNHS